MKLLSLFSLKNHFFFSFVISLSLSGFSSFFFFFLLIFFFLFCYFIFSSDTPLPPNSSISLSFCYLSQFFPTKKCGLAKNHEQEERLWELICIKHWANIGYPNQQLRSVVFATWLSLFIFFFLIEMSAT